MDTGVLKIKSFRDLFLGQTISQFGDSVYFLVFLFMAEKVSGDPMVVGLVGVLQAVPYVLFGPLAGVLADRLDRRSLMVFSDVASVVFMGALSVYAWFMPTPAVWVLCLAAFGMATVNTFFGPARSAAIPRLVPSEKVSEALSLAIATQQIMFMLGMALSAGVLGVVYSVAPGKFFFLAAAINTVTFVGSAWFLSRLPAIVPEREGLAESGGLGDALGRFWGETLEGFRAVRSDPVVGVALPMNVLATLAVAPFMLVYVEVNAEWYGGTFGRLALIELSFAFVTMVTSLWLGRRRVSRPGLAFAWGTMALGVLVLVMATGEGRYWWFLALNAACGFAFPFVILPVTAYIQVAIRDELRGRVNSAWTMASMAAQPAGIVAMAPVLKYWGLTGAFLVMGFGLGGAAIYGLVRRQFREARMPGGETV